MVLERRRRRNPQLALGCRRHVDRLLGDLAEGKALLAPLLAGHLREELFQRLGAHHGAGQVVPAARLGLLDHRDRYFAQALHRLGIVREQLQQPVGAREARGAPADDRDTDLDQLVLVVEPALDELLLRVDRRRERVGGDLAVVRRHD